jgi:hypothetical protein
MASITKRIALDVSAEQVWDVVRDFGAVHRRFAPGFVTDTQLDGDSRIVTFANGNIVRERLVDCNDTTRRLVYAIRNERLTQHSASFQVFDRGENQSELVWIADVLPNDIAPYIEEQMELGARAIARAFALSTAHG